MKEDDVQAVFASPLITNPANLFLFKNETGFKYMTKSY